MIIRIRTGSMMRTFYPFVQQADNQGVLWTAGSVQTTHPVLNAPLRVVGSGLGDGTSGLRLTIRYI